MKLLLTSIGKRIQLIEHLRTGFYVAGADASQWNPAKEFVDAFYQIPRCKEPGYVEALLKICEEEQISMLVPLYEPEFPYLDAARSKFESVGTTLVLSTDKVLAICNDKIKTAEFFEQYLIPAPKTYKNINEVTYMSFPLIIKPLDGMGSEGVFKLHNQQELDFFKNYVKSPIVQQCVPGTEYTIDVLCDLQGNPVYMVPRIRLEVRSGEVVKSRTDKNQTVIGATRNLLHCLNEEGTVIGPMTVQCFVTDEEEVSFIEINSRFGGGVPLSFEAGADYAARMVDMCKNTPCTEDESWQDGLTMMRYDRAVYKRNL